MDKEYGIEAMKASMKWYGWGSPVGLSIFFVGLALAGLILRVIFRA